MALIAQESFWSVVTMWLTDDDDVGLHSVRLGCRVDILGTNSSDVWR